MKWILPFVILIFFEAAADILSKQWSLVGGFFLAILAMGAYTGANTFWLFALKNGSGLARGAIMFGVVSAILAATIGVLLYKEPLSRIQLAGVLVGLVSITMLFWEG